MPTRNIVLTDDQESSIAKQIRAGCYQNASEMLREGMRLLQDATVRRETEIEAIRAGVLEGVSQANDGHLAAGCGEDAVNRAFARGGRTICGMK